MSTIYRELIDACSSGNFEKVKSLVEQGAIISQDDYYCVHRAVESGDWPTVQYLIDRMGSANLAFECATEEGNLEIMKNIRKARYDVSTSLPMCLQFAVRDKNRDVIKYLRHLTIDKAY